MKRKLFGQNGCEGYLIENGHTGTLYILKRCPQSRIRNPQVFYFLQQKQINNIVFIVAVWQKEGCFYSLEYYLHGESLWDWVQKGGSETEMRFLPAWKKQIREGLQQLHQSLPEAIIHGDITPKNIIVKRERAVLIDFNSADFLNTEKSSKRWFATRAFSSGKTYFTGELSVESDLIGLEKTFCWSEGKVAERLLKKTFKNNASICS